MTSADARWGTLEGEYEPSPSRWVRDQVETYEATKGRMAATLGDSGLPIVVYTCRGRSTGALRKFALMRVEHGGRYTLVASNGAAADHPAWYRNLVDDPTRSDLASAFSCDGDERAQWWDRAVAVFPRYEQYREATDRRIPLLLTVGAVPDAPS